MKNKQISKSLSRDASVIMKMISIVTKLRKCIMDSGCNFSSAPNGLVHVNNEQVFDLCSFYMSQLGEKVKLLTDSTKDELCKVFDIRACIKFRNLIDHDYEKLNKAFLVPYIQLAASNNFLNALKARYDYCLKNKRV